MKGAWRLFAFSVLVYLAIFTVLNVSVARQFSNPSNSSTIVNPAISAASAPLVQGWGGTQLAEAAANSGNPPSSVFTGEGASNMEMQMRRLQALGLTIMRVSWNTGCPGLQEMGPYDSTNLQRAISLAQAYNLWLIVDDHGYDDMQSGNISCWLTFWSPIVTQFKGSYSNIIWEPENEPRGIDVPTLSSAYQQWINQARNTGDTHWIVVQNLCSYGCGLSDMSQGYPTVTDPQNKILISLHSYHYYSQFSSSWNNATAESDAQVWYQAVSTGVTNTGWHALNTEGGADNGCTLCAPDTVLPGSAGYSIVTLHFIQTLTNLYNLNHISWVWWADGSWTDTPCAGTYGALQPNPCPGGSGYSGGVGWGNLISNPSPCVNNCGPPPLTVSFNHNPSSTIVNVPISFNAFASGGTGPYTYTWSFGDSGTGAGTPVNHTYSSPGSYNVTLTATDSTTQKAVASQLLNVTPPLFATFTYAPLNPTLQTTISFNATISGGAQPYSVSWDFGDSGTASGSKVTHAYAQQGTYTVRLTVTDSLANSGQAQTSIIVSTGSSVNTAPVLFVPGLRMVVATQSISFPVTATDTDADPTITLTALGIPSGASFVPINGNPAIGTFSWIPALAQGSADYTITFSADDGHGNIVSNSVTIHVAVSSVPPLLVVPGPQTAVVGQTLSFTVGVTDPNIPRSLLILSATGLVSGMSLNLTTGAFSFTPDGSQAGRTFNITFVVIDNGSPPLSDTKTESIHVLSSSGGPGGGTGSGGVCLICEIFPTNSPTLLLLSIGGILGLAFSIVAIALRARAYRTHPRISN